MARHAIRDSKGRFMKKTSEGPARNAKGQFVRKVDNAAQVTVKEADTCVDKSAIKRFRGVTEAIDKIIGKMQTLLGCIEKLNSKEDE